MNATHCCGTWILALLATTAVTVADTSDPALQAFTKTQFYNQLLSQVFAKMPPELFRRCPGLVSTTSHVTVLGQITFAADGYPNRGSWRQSFPVSGCGSNTTLNLFFQATREEKINTIVGLSGNTIADLTLQHDAEPFARMGAEARNQTCHTFAITNTRFEGFGTRDPHSLDPGPGAGYRPWWETWTLAGCGHTYSVPLDFMPDKTGTQIVQPAGAVVEH